MRIYVRSFSQEWVSLFKSEPDHVIVAEYLDP